MAVLSTLEPCLSLKLTSFLMLLLPYLENSPLRVTYGAETANIDVLGGLERS